MTFHGRYVLGARVLVVVGLMIGATPAPARADSLERQLLRQAPPILKSLQDRGVKRLVASGNRTPGVTPSSPRRTTRGKIWPP